MNLTETTREKAAAMNATGTKFYVYVYTHTHTHSESYRKFSIDKAVFVWYNGIIYRF